MPDKEKYLQFGKYTKKPPKWLVNKVKTIDTNITDIEYIKKVLRVIYSEFDPALHIISTTNNYYKSRFIGVNDIINRRLASCGALATVVASILRSINIPTKLIHGRYVEGKQNILHAWNEVLIGEQWIPFDIKGKQRGISKYHIREAEMVDWYEIEGKKPKNLSGN